MGRRARSVGLRWRRSEEVCRVAVLKSQLPAEAGILRARADVNAPRCVEFVAVNEKDAEARQRLAAPADRRTRVVRAELELDRDPQLFPHVIEGRDVRLPQQAEQQPSFVFPAAQRVCASVDDLDVVG